MTKKKTPDPAESGTKAGKEEPRQEDGGQEEPITDEQAQADFEEGAGTREPDDTASSGKETTDEKATEDTKVPGESEEKLDEVKPGETEPRQKDGEQEPDKPTYEELEQRLTDTDKALTDTKTWGHTMAGRVAELESTAAKAPVDKKESETREEEVPDAVKAFYTDYPDAKAAILFEAKKMVKAQFGELDPTKVQEQVTKFEETIGQNNFEKAVVTGLMDEIGSWVPGHPDAYQIMASPEYKTWFEAELVKNPGLGGIANPKGAIEVIGRYKAEKARIAAQAHDKDQGKTAKELEDLSAAGPEAGNKITVKTGKKDDDDKSPEELFDEGANS